MSSTDWAHHAAFSLWLTFNSPMRNACVPPKRPRTYRSCVSHHSGVASLGLIPTSNTSTGSAASRAAADVAAYHTRLARVCSELNGERARYLLFGAAAMQLWGTTRA